MEVSLVTRRCVQCGKPFEAKRSTAKYDSASCRARASQGAAPVVLPVLPLDEGKDLGAVETTRAELTRFGRLDTPLGQHALFLAQRMVNESGSALAALSREWRATREAAIANAKVTEDPVEKLRLVVGDRRGGS